MTLAFAMSLRQQRREYRERVSNVFCVAILWSFSLWATWQVAIRMPDVQKNWCMAAVERYEDMRVNHNE